MLFRSTLYERLHDSFEGPTKRQVREDLRLALRLSDGDGPIVTWITGLIVISSCSEV